MSAATEVPNINIREINEFAQMRAVEELQKEVWGIPDLDVVPLTHLVAAKEAGGVLLGAFDGETLVGFVYGFTALEHGELAHHSHMLAVKPAFRNFDLGRRLKLAQREQVVGQGIAMMTWTFDPLQSLNAYFNFAKLGVLSDRYLCDFYGEDPTSFLHQTGTDRLWVSWFVSSARVTQRISGGVGSVECNVGLPIVRLESDEAPGRGSLSEVLAQDHATIEIPADINALQERRPEIAAKWREATRWAFTEALEAGYVVTEFSRELRNRHSIGKYLLSKRTLIYP